jgi:NAD+ diphosphatase
MEAPDRPNVFSGPYIDRQAPARRNPRALTDALADPSARIALVWRSRSLVRRGPALAACLLEADACASMLSRPDDLILLGRFRGAPTLVLEIEGEQPPEAPGGGEFVDLRRAGALLEFEEAGLLAYARAMISWRNRHRYCGRCGSPNRALHAGHVMACTREGCDTQVFPRLDPAVIVLVTDGERALLGRQATWPAGRYSTVAGFVEPGESLEDAVRREVLEETGVRVGALRYHSSQPWPFPASLMLGFIAQAASHEIRLCDDELEDARWFSREEIASGVPKLPPPQSVSFRLIEDWYDSGSARPLAAEPRAARWDAKP